jgi:hypothetical protein
MLTNFEEITEELSQSELGLIPILVKGFERRTKENPIKAPEIIEKVNGFLKENNYGITISEPRLRKCVNFIRTNSILPLIATSKGYYCSWDLEEITAQIKSLSERSNSILNCAKGMAKFLEQINWSS